MPVDTPAEAAEVALDMDRPFNLLMLQLSTALVHGLAEIRGDTGQAVLFGISECAAAMGRFPVPDVLSEATLYYYCCIICSSFVA